MESLDQIKSSIESSFPEGWLEGLSIQDLEAKYPDIIDSTAELVFNLFCDSLISGEYFLAGSKKTKETLDSIEKYVDGKFDEMGDDDKIQKFLDEQLRTQLVNFIKRLIYIYKSFSAHLSLLTTYPFHEINYSVPFESSHKVAMKGELTDKLNLFMDYVEVQLIDHFFNDDSIVIRNITETLTAIKRSQTPSKIKTSVIEKLNFLKHKWILRQYVYSMNDESLGNKGYISDGEVKEHFGDEEFHTQNEVLNNWTNYLESHYQLDSQWRLKIDRRAQELKTKDLNGLKFIEVHALIKYYKDVQKSPLELRVIADFLVKEREKIKESSKIHVYNKAIIYTLNNLYSLMISLSEVNGVELKEIKKEIELLQAKYSIDNFFADKKYIGFQLDRIQDAFDQRSILENLEKETLELNKLEDIVKRCKKRMQWAYNHHSLIFQLPYEQSLVPVSYEEFKGVYYASTFALPIPQYTNQKEFKQLEVQFEKLTLLTNSISSLKLEFGEIGELKNDLKNNDFRSLEIIGIFTAIVTFVISLIPAFKFIENVKQAILFYGVLAASLSTMVVILLLIKRGSKALSQNWISILSLILVIIFGAVFFVSL